MMKNNVLSMTGWRLLISDFGPSRSRKMSIKSFFRLLFCSGVSIMRESNIFIMMDLIVSFASTYPSGYGRYFEKGYRTDVLRIKATEMRKSSAHLQSSIRVKERLT